jgi:hypothetical protein
MRVRSCGALRCRKCGPSKRFGMTAGRPAKAPVLHHMRKKPSLAGRRGRGGVGFSFILKRLLHVSVLRPAIATASCAHPAMLTAKWLPRANRLCAAGSNKPRTLEAVRLKSLDQLIAQAGQRPRLGRLRHRQRPHEVAQVIGQGMKLKANRVGGEGAARQARPLDRLIGIPGASDCLAAAGVVDRHAYDDIGMRVSYSFALLDRNRGAPPIKGAFAPRPALLRRLLRSRGPPALLPSELAGVRGPSENLGASILTKASSLGPFCQPSERRNWPGVTPVTRRKFSVRRLWLEKPAASAIAAIERSSLRRSSVACCTRLSVTN